MNGFQKVKHKSTLSTETTNKIRQFKLNSIIEILFGVIVFGDWIEPYCHPYWHVQVPFYSSNTTLFWCFNFEHFVSLNL